MRRLGDLAHGDLPAAFGARERRLSSVVEVADGGIGRYVYVAAHQPEALAREHLDVVGSAKPAGARAAPEMKMQLSSCEVRLQSARGTG